MGVQEASDAFVLVLEWLLPQECLSLASLNTVVRVTLKSTIERELTFRIPYNETMKTLTPLRVVATTTISIPPNSISLNLISQDDEEHLNRILTTIPPIKQLTFGHYDTPQLPISTTITHLITSMDFNQMFPEIPPTLTHLTTGDNFNYPIPTATGLTHLTLGFSFNQHISSAMVPSLQRLIFVEGSMFNHNVDSLPHSLLELTLGFWFDYPLDKLPPNLTHLSVRGIFNYTIDNLPPRLTHLKTGHEFNQPIDNLPSTLTHLETRRHFNQPIDNLPPSLTHLSLSQQFNQPVDKLPQTLLRLSVGYYFNQLVNNLPPTLTHLRTGGCFQQSVDRLPSSITHLTTADNFKYRVPSGVIHKLYSEDETDELEDNYDPPQTKTNLSLHKQTSVTHLELSWHLNGSLDNLPHTLTHLTLGYYFNCELMDLPTSLTHLTTGHYFNQPLDKLPSHLVSLTTGFFFEKPIDHLPQKLLHLKTGLRFNQPVNKLPPTLLSLITGNCFDQPVETLPATLLTLTTGYRFNQPINNLPSTLTNLTTGYAFNQPISHLPPSLKHLTVGASFQQPTFIPPAVKFTRISKYPYGALETDQQLAVHGVWNEALKKLVGVILQHCKLMAASTHPAAPTALQELNGLLSIFTVVPDCTHNLQYLLLTIATDAVLFDLEDLGVANLRAPCIHALKNLSSCTQ